MGWVLSYIDVEIGQPLTDIEDRCFQGWEPFAVVNINSVQRFWFKKHEPDSDPLAGQVYPIILREDMKELLDYARGNDQCDSDDFKKMDSIAARWHLE